MNDQFVKMLSLTDGRDKTYKFLQGAAKALAHYSSGELGTKCGKLGKSLGEGRSIMRLAKWTTNIQKINGIIGKAAQRGWNQFLILELLRVLGDAGYVIGDNLSYLSKYKVFSLDPAKCTKYGKNAQFWGFFCQLILDVFGILMLDPRTPNYAEARQTAILTITKNLSDTLVILSVVGYLPKKIYNPNAGVQGILLALSGLIATYQNWNKASPSLDKKKQ